MTWLRHIPLIGLLLPISAEEHAKRREKEAKRKAEEHRQEAVELADRIALAQVEREHHAALAATYDKRLTVQPMQRPLEARRAV